jgi:hypothetical protein
MTPAIDTTAVVVRQSVLPSNAQIVDVQQLGTILAKSGYFADAREQAQAAVKVLAGAELGIPPIAAMMGIYIIKGKATLGAHLIASRVRAHGYDWTVKRLDNTGCVLTFLSKVDAEGKRHKLGDSAFVEEDAKAAGVLTNPTWKSFPRNMYYARAMSNGCKWFTPEVTSGMPVYTPEEMGAAVDGEGEVIQIQQPVAERRIEEERAKLAEVRSERPWTTFNGMCAAFAAIKDALKPYTGPYYEKLKKYGVEHANDFSPSKLSTLLQMPVSAAQAAQKAFDCYRELLAVVADYEAMKSALTPLDEHLAQEEADGK